MAKLRVLLADDHGLMLEAVRLALTQDGDFEVVAATTEATKVLALVKEHLPDVVVLDVRMPQLDGITCLKRIRAGFPAVVVVMLSASEEPTIIEEAMANGAGAFALKHIDPRDLGAVIRQARAGTVFQSTSVFASSAAKITAAVGLTVKEGEVLNRLACGLSNGEIAKELWLSPQTVKFHLSSVYRKLDVSSRMAAVEKGREKGLISNPLLQEA